jgi:exo-beta-1,3-glucanase (GH17 family)
MRFVEAMLREVKTLDPNRLRTTGLAFAKSHFEPREASLRVADMVDFYTFHYYDDSPYDSGRYKAHWYYGQGFTRDLYRSLQELKALGQNKPVVVTEIGFVTDGREATRSLAQHHADLKLARELIRESGGAGLVIWSFQSTFDDAVGDVFPR